MKPTTLLLEYRPLARQTLHVKPGYKPYRVRWTQPNIICISPNGAQERHTPPLTRLPINPHYKGDR